MTATVPPPARIPAISWHGVRTMAEQEFRLRLRAGKWRWLLAGWFLLLLAFTGLLWLAIPDEPEGYVEYNSAPVDVERHAGTTMFGGLMFFVLGILLLVVPALTAQSVNGDRERGVLATLQTTLLTPAEIAVGKLLAAWGTATVFVALALPMVGWAMLEGGVGVGRALIALLVVVLLLGVVAAVAQCLSAVLARTTTSAVLSYLFVFGLAALTAVAFGLALPATATERTHVENVPIYDESIFRDPNFVPTAPPTPIRYERQEWVERSPDTTKVWWLLAPNPFVVLADAAPHEGPKRCVSYEALDPLRELANAVRSARSGDESWTQCYDASTAAPAEPGPVWPYGIAFDVLLGAGALALTIRRLRAPVHTLPRAVRIA